MTIASIAGVLFLILIAGAVALWIASAGWVIRELRRTDHPNALVWSVGALVLGYLAPILYLVTQHSARSAVYGPRSE